VLIRSFRVETQPIANYSSPPFSFPAVFIGFKPMLLCIGFFFEAGIPNFKILAPPLNAMEGRLLVIKPTAKQVYHSHSMAYKTKYKANSNELMLPKRLQYNHANHPYPSHLLNPFSNICGVFSSLSTIFLL
jgi:hypothetical protein